jgi:hypothetical protein
MRTFLGGLTFIMVASIVTMSARAIPAQTDRGGFAESARMCRARESADSAAAKDLNPTLVSARTVFLIKESSIADDGRSLAELRHELQRWHRWEEVPRRNAADVTVTVSVMTGESGSPTLTLGVRARATDSVLWASSGRDAAAALRSLEDRLPSLEGACAPIQVL